MMTPAEMRERAKASANSADLAGDDSELFTTGIHIWVLFTVGAEICERLDRTNELLERLAGESEDNAEVMRDHDRGGAWLDPEA